HGVVRFERDRERVRSAFEYLDTDIARGDDVALRVNVDAHLVVAPRALRPAGRRRGDRERGEVRDRQRHEQAAVAAAELAAGAETRREQEGGEGEGEGADSVSHSRAPYEDKGTPAGGRRQRGDNTHRDRAGISHATVVDVRRAARGLPGRPCVAHLAGGLRAGGGVRSLEIERDGGRFH